jgi:hypothetical protein
MKFIYPFADINKSCYYHIIRYNLSGDNLEIHTRMQESIMKYMVIINLDSRFMNYCWKVVHKQKIMPQKIYWKCS